MAFQLLSPTYVSLPLGGVSTNRNLQATFAGYTPLVGDVVQFYFASAATTPAIFDVSGWKRWRDSTPRVTSDSNYCSMIYHLVSPAEETAATTTYAANTFFDANITAGHLLAVVVRGMDTSVLGGDIPWRGAGSTNSNVTTHVAPAIAGTGLPGGCLVMRFVTGDGTEQYGSMAGHTKVLQAPSGTSAALFSRDALTTAGVQVDAANVTVTTAEEYAALSVALDPLVTLQSLTPPVRRPNYGSLMQL